MQLLNVGPFEIQVEAQVLLAAGKPVSLGRKVVATLLVLAAGQGGTVSKSALLDGVWPEGWVSEANLSQNIYVLRKLFKAYGCENAIETVPCRGYRLMVPVSCKGNGPSARGVKRQWPIPGRGVVVAVASVLCVLMIVSASTGHRASTKIAETTAYQFYRVGRYFLDQRTRLGVRTSLDYFTRAINADPKDWRSYAAMADANVIIGDYCYGTHQSAVYFARANSYAANALAIKPDAAEPHASVGFIALHQRNQRLALREFDRAVDLDPAYAPAREWRGIAYLRAGRNGAAVADLKEAAKLDPLSPSTIVWLASAAFAQHRYRQASLYARMALELSPSRGDALAILGRSYAASGDGAAAVKTFRQYGRLSEYSRANAAALLARTFAMQRRPKEAYAEFAFALSHSAQVEPGQLLAAAQALRRRAIARKLIASSAYHAAWAAVENANEFVSEMESRS